MGAILPMGKALVKSIMLFRGKRYRSPFVAGLAFAGYNKYFEKGNPNAWLTRDLPLVSDRGDDPYTSFIFTLSAYHDLFTMLENISKRSWYDSYPKELPTLIMSGTMDPVGQYSEGPRRVFEGLSSRGAAVDIRMYEDARHELFNELCREEVFRDIRDFLERLV
jgi:alpha-beta hydrolase superfamily lysophospholipase